MLELQTPPRPFVLRDTKPAPVKPAPVVERSGPLTSEEWAKLKSDDRRLARVLGVMALAVMSAALAVFGTIAILAAIGSL
jgi:hypothetical protein